MYEILHALLADKTGGTVFKCFDFTHFCFIIFCIKKITNRAKMLKHFGVPSKAKDGTLAYGKTVVKSPRYGKDVRKGVVNSSEQVEAAEGTERVQGWNGAERVKQVKRAEKEFSAPFRACFPYPRLFNGFSI